MTETQRQNAHKSKPAWWFTPEGKRRGYIQPHALEELWFHTGTICNLACPFCLEGSRPGDRRLDMPAFDDVRAYMDEALGLGVERFSFTGGEPFVNKHLLSMLEYGLDHRPCLVLSNGTEPLRKCFRQLEDLLAKPNPLNFRISIDYPDEAAHDSARGAGRFRMALDSLRRLAEAGFGVSAARLAGKNEEAAAVDAAYRRLFRETGVPDDLRVVPFPDFHGPGAHPAGVPHITENCMTTYQDAESRAGFMCAFSKMIVKKNGRMRVYACTLVDDDADYDLGVSLEESLKERIMLKHHRCFSCFACGASCSEG
jgi:MoaA/NifB/PqqE/SkfB family radical SAM enzyme